MNYSIISKKILCAIVMYAKRHIFHFMVLVAFAFIGLIELNQYTLILKERSNLAFMIENQSKHVQGQYDALHAEIAAGDMAINSRIDILDSAIKPEEKRRTLVQKIRKAIQENTTSSLTVREMNNIAIAVIDYSYQYNLSIAKVLAQIKQESNFNIMAISPAGAQGLMQIMPETLEYIQLKEMDGKKLDMQNVYHNIKAGCFYMSEQMHHFPDYDMALRAYNWGPDKVRKLLAGQYTEKDIPEETRKYVESINILTKVFEKYGLE